MTEVRFTGRSSAKEVILKVEEWVVDAMPWGVAVIGKHLETACRVAGVTLDEWPTPIFQ